MTECWALALFAEVDWINIPQTLCHYCQELSMILRQSDNRVNFHLTILTFPHRSFYNSGIFILELHRQLAKAGKGLPYGRVV
jgi:hypothetical protein